MSRLSFAANQIAPKPGQYAAKASSSQIGSAMAVLATLEQAQVLPPEGTREANRIVKSVIQFQSVFSRSIDPSVQDFVRRAVRSKHGEHATDILVQFRSSGWTPEILEALADADLRTPVDELQSLATGLGQFNVSVEDFKRFMQLVRDGEQALASRGQNFQEVYASHRNTMPGAAVR
ncbi:MAG: hypothetical protein HY038_11215 [Nitrospirae bacterium]|nr:hypothetical protein [Nitrospirota bacterium]